MTNQPLTETEVFVNAIRKTSLGSTTNSSGDNFIDRFSKYLTCSQEERDRFVETFNDHSDLNRYREELLDLSMRAKFYNTGINSRDREYFTFDTFKLNSKNMHFKDTMMKLQRYDITKPYGIIFIGDKGTGKTHLLKALLQNLHDDKKFPCAFYPMGRLMQDFTLYYKETAIIKQKYMDPMGLFIDDLGAFEMTKYGPGNFQQVLDYRYGNGKPTFISSDIDSGDITAKFGERITERIRQGFKACRMNWPSYRSQVQDDIRQDWDKLLIFDELE